MLRGPISACTFSDFIEVCIVNEPFCGWNSRVCGCARIMKYIGVNKYLRLYKKYLRLYKL
jgi:hypothetical protein